MAKGRARMHTPLPHTPHPHAHLLMTLIHTQATPGCKLGRSVFRIITFFTLFLSFQLTLIIMTGHERLHLSVSLSRTRLFILSIHLVVRLINNDLMLMPAL